MRPNEGVGTPENWLAVYCRFDGDNAWALVGAFKDGQEDAQWAAGGYDFSQSPQPDDTANGTTYRFPFSFWNDVSSAVPTGAMTWTTGIIQSEDASYMYCSAFWKTDCKIVDNITANNSWCFKRFREYSHGVFTGQLFNVSDATRDDTVGSITGCWGGNGALSVRQLPSSTQVSKEVVRQPDGAG